MLTPTAPAALAKILIVEDENIVAKDIEQTVRALGYSVAGTAGSGEDAIRKARETSPDLVLMDIRLRGVMDGTEAAERIHRQLGIPVVFLTAHADEATLRRAQETGPYGYVLKPFEERELSVALAIALAKRQAFQQLETRVEARTRELAAAVHARDEFLLVAAHELRTPVTALQLQLHGLKRLLVRGRAGDGDDAVARKADGALRATERLAALIERLLDVSVLSLGHLELALASARLGDVVRETVQAMQPEAERAACELRVTVRGEDAEGTWDRERLAQVVTSLLSNALKYGAGTPVDVEVSARDGVARIRVTDRGIGIAPHDLERIFGRFERAAPSRQYGGLGLGLYVAGQLVQAHGGAIRVDSRPGEGATFTVELPLSPPGAAPTMTARQ